MKYYIYCLFVTSFLSCNLISYNEYDDKVVYNAIGYVNQQYPYLIKQTTPDKFPKTFENDSVKFSNSSWWCSGFYAGNLFQLFELTEDSIFYLTAIQNLAFLEKEQYNRNTHDLGFMMFNSFGKLYKLQPDSVTKNIIIQSAKSLASRYSDTVKAIRSWDSHPDDFLVIIDNMMNLEMLMWASDKTHDSIFKHIAEQHAQTTIKNHFRPNQSSYHLVNYDPNTGIVKEKKTVQGLHDESTWARGQAWGLYGFVKMYQLTQQSMYLEKANQIAEFILNHPRLPKDKIPYWDFDLKDTLNGVRDASAAAIIGSALFQLAMFQNEYSLGEKYQKASWDIFENLFTHYRFEIGKGGGFLLDKSVGHFSASSEVSVPIMYADYYFLELISQWKWALDL